MASVLAITLCTATHLQAQAVQAQPQSQAQAGYAARARSLLGQMTLEEKASQLQNGSAAIPRLGIPAYNWWSEGLHGVARAGEATVFPQAIGLAASWNVPLVHQVADTTSTEFRAKYLKTVKPDGSSAIYQGLTVWSPNVNIFRDPRWGRGQETYGEDPYLTSRMGVAYIEGLQGNPDTPKVSATVKHFAVHSGPEADRHREDIHPSKYDLIDTYLPAFHAAITEAKALSIMCAYNAVDGLPACANTQLLKDYLRTSWNFKGHVVSDCGAVADIYTENAHHYTQTAEEAVAVAIKAGTDVICDFGTSKTNDPATIVRAVKQGLMTEADVDRALMRLLEVRISLGLLDKPGTGPYKTITAADFDTPAHQAINLEAARQSLVLLKNDGTLPLKSDTLHIAVIGPNADSVDALVGNYNGTPSKPITVLAGLRARFPNASIDYVEGTGIVAPPLEDVPEASLCLDAACAQPGVKLEQFDNLNLEGTPVSSETVSKAEIRWGRPNPGDRKTSTRWTTYIRATESGMHNFRLKSNQGYRIKIDGNMVTDMWDIAWPTSNTVTNLEAGKVYKVEIESQQLGFYGQQILQWTRPSSDDSAAIAAAKKADLVVFVSGLNWQFEGEEMTVRAPGFAGGDRTSLNLPAPQETLLESLGATGKPLVVVNLSGSAMALNWADQNASAIIQGWYPGGEGGQAIAELIAGDFNPAGRLPVTFYKSENDLPPFSDYGMKGRTYKYFKGTPLYPFGHGLSYSHFTYSAAGPALKDISAGKDLNLTVAVKNDGQRDGDEVVQVYLKRPQSASAHNALVAFKRIALKAGQSQNVSFTLTPTDFSSIDEAGNRSVESGLAEIWVGGSQPVESQDKITSRGVALQTQIKGQEKLPQF
ncbi:MAG: glycoside hydrolase family 3 C-terminal domain-containing protein [Asticcacaulis sp.]